MQLQKRRRRHTIWRRRRITMGSGMRLQGEQGRRTTWWWRGMGSYHRCDYKGSRDDVQSGGGEGWGHITDATKGAEMTYNLEAERERDGVRSRMRLQKEQGRRTIWRRRRSTMGSDHGCDCKGSRDDVPSGGGEGSRWGQGCDCKRSR